MPYTHNQPANQIFRRPTICVSTHIHYHNLHPKEKEMKILELTITASAIFI